MTVVSLLLDVLLHSCDARGKCGEGMLTVGVLSNIATERLLRLGMRRVIVPFGADDGEPHTVILVSADFQTNSEKVAVLVCLPTPLTVGWTGF